MDLRKKYFGSCVQLLSFAIRPSQPFFYFTGSFSQENLPESWYFLLFRFTKWSSSSCKTSVFVCFFEIFSYIFFNTKESKRLDQCGWWNPQQKVNEWRME